eukprot:TRINITY_DN59707_c0_g1_i1.p1 TRINITY_DN59707_c0_g1~~TRINITY_DN59707_c0_g1_i1.p1  ORF type:complete len:347 (-),score=30.30 TRINITY_DN59707_c0_g1_i1:85-1068(-)
MANWLVFVPFCWMVLPEVVLASCEGFVQDCVPRTGTEACGASFYNDYEAKLDSKCDYSGISLKDDGVCAKPSRTVSGKTALTCSPWEVVECSKENDVSLGGRPVGSSCSQRRRSTEEGRVCMMYTADGTASSKMQCAPLDMSRCHERKDGAECATDQTCRSSTAGSVLRCTKNSEHACWGKTDGELCSFKVDHGKYGSFVESSKCISATCEAPRKAACFDKTEGEECAAHTKLTQKRFANEHRRRRALIVTEIRREEMTGGVCKGALSSSRSCEDAVVKLSELLYSTDPGLISGERVVAFMNRGLAVVIYLALLHSCSNSVGAGGWF